MSLYLAGKYDEARLAYEKLLAAAPNDADALHMLGVLATHRNDYPTAADFISRAIAQRGNAPEYHLNLGEAYRRSGKLAEAVASYQRAIKLRPQYPKAYNNLGDALRQLGKFPEAASACETAVRMQPNFGKGWSNLATALEEMNEHPRAEQAARRAVELMPDYASAWNTLGVALTSLGRTDEAIASLRKAISLQPDHVGAHVNLGAALDEQRKLDEALQAYDRAIALRPDYVPAKYNRSMHLLWTGDYERGWDGYEYRFVTGRRAKRHFAEPEWDGADLSGKTILLHVEQGFGDTIQFIRYATVLAKNGARVIAEVQPALVELARTVPGVTEVIAAGKPLPKFDVQAPMLSIPRIVKTRLDSIPAPIPYLSADPLLVAKWKDRFDPTDARLRVGIVWSGNPDQKNDRNRSTRPERFAPLAKLSNVQLYSLQKNPTVNWSGPGLIDWTNDLTDFSQTAAMIANLDLVVSVCTSVAHVAGAMGAPLWVALTYAADWRWFVDREDCPWYPNARLFRQKSSGAWDELMARIAGELAKLPPRK